MENPDIEKKLAFACPVCGRKTRYDVVELFEGAILTCPFCKLRLDLHGCMWDEVRAQIQKLEREG